MRHLEPRVLINKGDAIRNPKIDGGAPHNHSLNFLNRVNTSMYLAHSGGGSAGRNKLGGSHRDSHDDDTTLRCAKR